MIFAYDLESGFISQVVPRWYCLPYLKCTDLSSRMPKRDSRHAKDRYHFQFPSGSQMILRSVLTFKMHRLVVQGAKIESRHAKGRSKTGGIVGFLMALGTTFGWVWRVCGSLFWYLRLYLGHFFWSWMFFGRHYGTNWTPVPTCFFGSGVSVWQFVEVFSCPGEVWDVIWEPFCGLREVFVFVGEIYVQVNLWIQCVLCSV